MDDRKPPTPRQLEILMLFAEGKRRPEIAAELFLSQRSIDTAMTRVRERMGVNSTCQAIAVCVTHGYLAVDGRQRVLHVPRPFDDLVAA